MRSKKDLIKQKLEESILKVRESGWLEREKEYAKQVGDLLHAVKAKEDYILQLEARIRDLEELKNREIDENRFWVWKTIIYYIGDFFHFWGKTITKWLDWLKNKTQGLRKKKQPTMF